MRKAVILFDTKASYKKAFRQLEDYAVDVKKENLCIFVEFDKYIHIEQILSNIDDVYMVFEYEDIKGTDIYYTNKFDVEDLSFVNPTIDDILDKIRMQGKESLTEKEINILENI